MGVGHQFLESLLLTPVVLDGQFVITVSLSCNHQGVFCPANYSSSRMSSFQGHLGEVSLSVCLPGHRCGSSILRTWLERIKQLFINYCIEMTPRIERITWLSASTLPFPLWHRRSHSHCSSAQYRRITSCSCPWWGKKLKQLSNPHPLPFRDRIQQWYLRGKAWFHLSVLAPQEIFIALSSLVAP